MNSLRHRRKISILWNHFTRVDCTYAKCHVCSSNLSYKTTINNLKKHLISRHPMVKLEREQGQEQEQEEEEQEQEEEDKEEKVGSEIKYDRDSRYSKINSYTTESNSSSSSNINTNFNITPIPQETVKRKSSVYLESTINELDPNQNIGDKKKIDDALMQLFIKDLQLFQVVEDKGFKKFIKALNPSYDLLSKNYISETAIPAIFKRMLSEIKKISKTIVKCSLTTDCWTSCDSESVVDVSIHFINDNFELKTIFIGSIYYNESHLSTNLTTKFKELVDKWELTDKISFAISDNVANIKSAITMNSKWDHFNCLANSINLIIQEGLMCLAALINKIRKIVKHFKNNSSACDQLIEYQMKFENAQDPKKLIIDDDSWNSTYYMLERISILRNAVTATIALLDDDLKILTSEEWLIVGQAVRVLKPFESITKIVSGEKYLPASLVIILVNGLINVMDKMELHVGEPDMIIEVLIISLRESVHKRFAQLETNNTLSIATFLDPRFKNIAFLNDATANRNKNFILNSIISKLNANNANQSLKMDLESKTIDEDEESIWGFYDKTAAKIKLKETAASRAMFEVQRYLEEAPLPRSQDPLLWWSQNHYNYPNMSQLVKNYLCAMATSIPCDRLFSKAGFIFNERRSRLKQKDVKNLLFINQNSNLCNTSN